MKNRLIAALLCVCMALTLIFVSCGSKDGDVTQKTAEKEKVTNVYRTKYVKVPEDYDISTETISVKNGKISFECIHVTDEKTYTYDTILYTVDENGENPTEKIIASSGDTSVTTVNTNVNVKTTDSQENNIFVETTYDMETGTSSMLLKKTAADGTVIFELDPEPLFPEVDNSMYGGGGIYINNLLTDAEDNIYVASNQSVLVLDKDGKKLFDLTFDNWLDRMGNLSGGGVYVKYYDMNGSGIKFQTIDPTKKGFGEDLQLPANMGNNSEIFMGEGYDFYIKDDLCMYGYNSGDAEMTTLVNWLNSDIVGNSVSNIKIISPEKFVYSGYSRIEGGSFLAILTHVPDEEVMPKYLINLSCLYSSYTLPEYAVKFNQTNENYRVVIKDYSTYNTDADYDLGAKTFDNDMAAGNISDIVSLSGIDADKYISKDIFVDLYTYLDSETSKLKRDDLMKCVTTAFEHKGRLPRLATSFSVRTLSGKVSNIGSAKSWTIAEMLELRDSLPEGVALFGDDYMTKDYMLNTLMSVGFTEYINSETGECNFNNDSFIKLLEYCNTLPAEYKNNYEDYDQNEDRYVDYRENKAILNTTHLYDFSGYLQAKFAFNMEDINMIGYPTGIGCGAIIYDNSSYSITKASSVKDGAWEFLCFLMGDDNVISDSMFMDGFPSTKAGMAKAAENAQKEYYFFHYSGGWSGSNEPFEYDENNRKEDGMPGHLEQSDIDYMMAYFDTLTSAYSSDAQVMSIISEEAAYYFNGTKTASDVANIIQSRVSLYINEQM